MQVGHLDGICTILNSVPNLEFDYCQQTLTLDGVGSITVVGPFTDKTVRRGDRGACMAPCPVHQNDVAH